MITKQSPPTTDHSVENGEIKPSNTEVYDGIKSIENNNKAEGPQRRTKYVDNC